MTAAMDVFAASGAGDEALVARLLEDGADCNLGDTWTGAEDGSPVVLQKVASELHPKVRNHGEGPY